MNAPALKPYTADDYWNLPSNARAELIDGELYAMTPPKRVHQEIVTGVAADLTLYIREHSGPCRVYAAPFAVNLDGDESTWVEPDVSVICDPSKLSDRGCEGAPDLIIEVASPTSRRMDYIVKMARYQEAGVREYWIVDPEAGHTMVYRYQTADAPATYMLDEAVPVELFPGLLITVADLLR